jgi:hypothetical protein
MRRHREHVDSPAFMSQRTLCFLHSVHARILREIFGTCACRWSSGVKPPPGEGGEASPLASKWMRFRFMLGTCTSFRKADSESRKAGLGGSGSRPMGLWPEALMGLLRRRSRVGVFGVFLGHVVLDAKPHLV